LARTFSFGGPPLVWYDDGNFTLIVLDTHAELAGSFGQQPECALVSYLGYTIEQPLAGSEHLAAALRQTIGRARAGKVGVEERDVTALLAAVLGAALPSGAELTPIDGWLEPLRVVKTAEELAKLRENFALIDHGQAVARGAVQTGRREIDIWTDVHGAIERAAGQRVPLGNDCLVGRRQANISGWPLDLQIQPSDSLIVDLSTVLHGYWSDSCGTYYAGEPSERQVAMHRTVEGALAFAISLVRPGAIAHEIDRQVRQFIADVGYPVYPHHTGHGVGVTGHEAPRIVPYSEDVLQEGMVIMLEPGIYLPGETAVRLEHAVLVIASGAEVLTTFDTRLP
jgi:Xaa-Pro dipeptidase